MRLMGATATVVAEMKLRHQLGAKTRRKHFDRPGTRRFIRQRAAVARSGGRAQSLSPTRKGLNQRRRVKGEASSRPKHRLSMVSPS